MKEKDFEPKIVGFLCNWCAYAGADLKGVSRLVDPASVLEVSHFLQTRSWFQSVMEEIELDS